MEIWSGVTRSTTSASEKRAGRSGRLRKSDHISDLFNHQPDEEKEKKGTRVHLSQASRVLTDQHRQKVTGFLKEHPELKKGLEQIPLPGVDEERPQGAMVGRQIRAYLQWLEIREKHGGAPLAEGESETPFLAVHQLGKDTELKQLMGERETAQKGVQDVRQKNNPNYYYLVYPEAYSFN